MTTARFDFVQTPLSDLLLVQRKVAEDNRGFFSRFYCAEEFEAAGVHKPVVQINHTLTREKGAARGFHFQRQPYAEIKLISCLRGEILDVAVDIRRGSPTFLKWHGEILSAANRKTMLIPEGFAHGFQALAKDCELVYLQTAAYNPQFEGAINLADPQLAVSWPLPITDVSERDRTHPYMTSEFLGFTI
jgi:dTDP-4-dehydrorhamnose 3,5-epimerase